MTAGDERPRRETPAPGERPAADDVSAFGAGARVRRRPPRLPETPASRGARAAIVMFALALAAVLGTFAWARLSGASPNDTADAFLAVAGILIVAAMFGAPFVSMMLPKGARASFWSVGVICACLTAILWGVTCGLAGASPRIGG